MEQTKIQRKKIRQRFFSFFLNLDWFGRTENCGTTVATMFYFQSLFCVLFKFYLVLFGQCFFFFLNKNHNSLYFSGNVFFQPSSFQSFISLFGTSKSGFMVKIQCREYLFPVVAIFVVVVAFASILQLFLQWMINDSHDLWHGY